MPQADQIEKLAKNLNLIRRNAMVAGGKEEQTIKVIQSTHQDYFKKIETRRKIKAEKAELARSATLKSMNNDPSEQGQLQESGTEMMFRENVSIMFKVRDQQVHKNIIKMHRQDVIRQRILEQIRTLMRRAKRNKI